MERQFTFTILSFKIYVWFYLFYFIVKAVIYTISVKWKDNLLLLDCHLKYMYDFIYSISL